MALSPLIARGTATAGHPNVFRRDSAFVFSCVAQASRRPPVRVQAGRGGIRVPAERGRLRAVCR